MKTLPVKKGNNTKNASSRGSRYEDRHLSVVKQSQGQLGEEEGCVAPSLPPAAHNEHLHVPTWQTMAVMMMTMMRATLRQRRVICGLVISIRGDVRACQSPLDQSG